jgi:hypothetical protein
MPNVSLSVPSEPAAALKRFSEYLLWIVVAKAHSSGLIRRLSAVERMLKELKDRLHVAIADLVEHSTSGSF